MSRISDVIKDLWIDKVRFSELYEKVFGEPLKPRVSTISKKHLIDIKKLLDKESNSSKTKVKTWTVKVIKANEFKNTTWFMSGLWFSAKSVEEKKEEKEKKTINDDFAILKEQTTHERQEKEKTQSGGGWFFFDKKKPTYKTSAYSSEPVVEKKPFRKPVPSISTTSNSRPSWYRGRSKFKNRVNIIERKAVATPAALKQEKKASTSKNLIKKVEIVLQDWISVKEFSEKMWVELPEVMKVMLKNKIMVWINSALDFDTASLVAEELWIKAIRPERKLDVESYLSGDLQAILALDKWASTLEDRAPIVTVMGHVDHGKTTLLDYLRKTSHVDNEAGGITQGIWASVVDYDWQKIAFIDTPGHALFTSLRARGSKLTNIVILVVASDDGVMPQTVESINHAKAAGVPVVVAITKIDKPGKDPEKIKADLASHGLQPEDWGGDTPIIPISAHTGQGIPELLEAVLLQAEMLELKFNPNRSAVGVVLDAYKDPKQWVVTSIILMTGTLKIRDVVVAYNTYGKVRRIWDWTGKDISVAKWWDPIQVLWITSLPKPWHIVEIVSNEKQAIAKVHLLQEKRENEEEQTVMQQFLQQLQTNTEDMNILNVILKSDWSSSLEAMKQAVEWIETPDKIAIKIVHSDVGHFTDSDLSLAQASKALLLWFNISLNSNFKKKAKSLWVDVKNYDIIYELTDFLIQVTEWMIEIEQEEVVIWKLKILWVFFRKGKDMVIGGNVIEWRVESGIGFRIFRDEELFVTGHIQSLQKETKSVKLVTEGHECGMKVKVGKKIEEGDILEFFKMEDIVD